MKKLFTTTSVLFALSFGCLPFFAKAQLPVKFGIGAEAALPLGDIKNVYSLGAGASLNAKMTMPFYHPLEAVASLGYQQWFIKSSLKDDGVSNPKYVPLHLGGRYHFGTVLPLFAKFDIGPVFSLQKHENGEPKEGTGFLFSPGIGAGFGPMDVELKYEAWSGYGNTVSFVGLKASIYF